MVEHLVDLLRRHLVFSDEVEDDRRVDVSAARSHYESLKGREAHAGVD